MNYFKTTFTILIILTSVSIKAQQKSEAFNSTVSIICSCLNKIPFDSLSKDESKKRATTCFTTSALDKFVEIASERGLDFNNTTQMQNLGIEIGKELLVKKCDGYLKFANAAAGIDEEKESRKEDFTFVKIEAPDFLKLIVKDKQGRSQSFYWLGYFEGSDKFIGKLTNYAGKKLTIGWVEKEVFSPALNNYIKIKELTSLEAL